MFYFKGGEKNAKGSSKKQSSLSGKNAQKGKEGGKRQKQLEAQIEKLEARKTELDELLMLPENGANMQMVNEYTELQAQLEKLEEEYFSAI